VSPLLDRSRKVKLGADTPGDSKADREKQRDFSWDFKGISWDFIGI
jgi:hypothetical protein